MLLLIFRKQYGLLPWPCSCPHSSRQEDVSRWCEVQRGHFLEISGDIWRGYLGTSDGKQDICEAQCSGGQRSGDWEMGSATRTWTLAPARRCELAKLIISIYLPDTLDTLDTRYRCIYTSHLSLLYTKNGDLKSIQWQLAMK